MTSTLQVSRTLAVAAAVLFCTMAAAPQAAALPQAHLHKDHAVTMRPHDGAGMTSSAMQQIAALDKRIQMLLIDMQMFSGEMKVDVMASLLSALIERQLLMEGEMRTMREAMMRRRMEQREPPVVSLEQEPEGMCAPTN